MSYQHCTFFLLQLLTPTIWLGFGAAMSRHRGVVWAALITYLAHHYFIIIIYFVIKLVTTARFMIFQYVMLTVLSCLTLLQSIGFVIYEAWAFTLANYLQHTSG